MKDPITLNGETREYREAVVPGVYRVSYPHPYRRHNICSDYYTDRERAQIAALALIQIGTTEALDIDRLDPDGRWIAIDRW